MLVGMDWVTVGLILIAVTAYAAVVFYVRRRIAAEEAAGAAPTEGPDEAVPEGERPPSESKGWFSEHVTFYGPILALRTLRVHFFDVFRRISWPLKAYASVGVVAVVAISALFAFSLFFSLRYTLQMRPEPTGIYAPQNLLLIPGLNEFVPGTVAVWLALVLTLVVHEFGHGILSRVEGIKVKAAGLLVAVVPIGAFVEPDEEELEKAPRWSKMRMYGAGISNNIVFGLLAFFLMIVVFGLAVPIAAPVVSGVYKDYPAYNASVAPGSIVLALNGTPVENREDVARLLAPTQPGDHTSLTVEQDGVVTTSELTLAEWPSGNHTSGFMGVEYYNGQAIQEYVTGIVHPDRDPPVSHPAVRHIVGRTGPPDRRLPRRGHGLLGGAVLGLLGSGPAPLLVGLDQPERRYLQRAPDDSVRRRVHLPRGRRRRACPAPARKIYAGGGQRRLVADGRHARLADRAAVPVQPVFVMNPGRS